VTTQDTEIERNIIEIDEQICKENYEAFEKLRALIRDVNKKKERPPVSERGPVRPHPLGIPGTVDLNNFVQPNQELLKKIAEACAAHERKFDAKVWMETWGQMLLDRVRQYPDAVLQEILASPKTPEGTMEGTRKCGDAEIAKTERLSDQRSAREIVAAFEELARRAESLGSPATARLAREEGESKLRSYVRESPAPPLVVTIALVLQEHHQLKNRKSPEGPQGGSHLPTVADCHWWAHRIAEAFGVAAPFVPSDSDEEHLGRSRIDNVRKGLQRYEAAESTTLTLPISWCF
jgi:hypothetical protein